MNFLALKGQKIIARRFNGGSKNKQQIKTPLGVKEIKILSPLKGFFYWGGYIKPAVKTAGYILASFQDAYCQITSR